MQLGKYSVINGSDQLESFVNSDYLVVSARECSSTESINQNDLYVGAVDQYGSSIQRLAHAYESDREKRRDLLQEIHFQLWRSFARFDGRCSLRTWIYRVAHHVATSHVLREHRTLSRLVSLEQMESIPDNDSGQLGTDKRRDLERLAALIQRLKPVDRQVMVSYLEDMDGASIGEITGLSPANVAMRIHRAKKILARWFLEGESHAR
jgi:RNA polymerase sigma-70 factor (ECF subfamily)